MGSDPGEAVSTAAVAATPPAAAFDALLGATLAGRYKIVRKIGEGGMGAVYEAEHALIGKRVAVKVLLEKFVEKPDLVARLLQEARLASSIGHENIVDVTDFGRTDDGRSFVVMEHLDGESLAALLVREAPLPVERTLRIARQVASALSAAHAKGILHRDVKPENVYLVRRGDADFVKVVDFGISKAVRTGDDNPESQRLTHTGMVLGTPLYMSPEQARGGQDIDHRADVWAVGVMLYECLTGEAPFRAANYLGIIAAVLTHEPPAPSELRPELGIPAAVESVVLRAMHKDRQQRYQTMADLEADLGRVLAGDHNVGMLAVAARAATPAPSPPGLPLGIKVAIAAACVGFVALVVLLLGRQGGSAPPPAPSAPSLPRPAVARPAPPPAPPASAPPIAAGPVQALPENSGAEGRARPRPAAPAPLVTPPPTPRPGGENSIPVDTAFPGAPRR